MTLEIPYNDRVLIVGQTGSGKSFFAQHVLLDRPRLIVFDIKGDMDIDAWRLEPYTGKAWRNLQKGKNGRIYIGPPKGVENSEQYWEEWLARCFTLRNVAIYIDELYGVGPGQGSPGLQALYTRGRSLGISVWASSQRPFRIPLFSKSEAGYIIMFRLFLADDRKEMADMLGPDVEQPIRDHAFWLFDGHTGKLYYYKKLTPI